MSLDKFKADSLKAKHAVTPEVKVAEKVEKKVINKSKKK